MEGPLRGCLAGLAAWKWGGGCLSMIVIFIIVIGFSATCTVDQNKVKGETGKGRPSFFLLPFPPYCFLSCPRFN